MLTLLLIVLISAPGGVVPLIQRFQRIERDVMHGRVDARVARSKLAALMPRLRQQLLADVAFRRPTSRRWRFPVLGGSRRHNVGGKGSGYRPLTPKPSYSFYHGNKHGGHPAHDVFIHDRNGDCKDDRTAKPVPVVAMTRSIVVSVNRAWKAGLPRGGIYLWLYEPVRDEFHYYAHLDRLDVRLGQVLQPGQQIGTVGKTGFKRRRPCHIHLMVLRFDKARMSPVNYYDRLP